MNLVWHIFWKDFRRLRLVLGLWLLLPLLRMGLVQLFTGQAVTSPAAFDLLSSWLNVWSGMTWLVGFILAAWLVMEDGLVSTRAFWRTRPIHGRRLLAAKLLGAILLFGVLPTLVMVPVWLGCGFSAREAGLAALELMLKQGIFTLVAFAIAGVTETSGQFLVRLIGTAILGVLALVYCAGLSGGLPAYLADGMAESRYRLVVGIFFLIPIAMVLNQYLTLRRLRAYVLLAGGIGLMFAVRWGWHGDLTPYFRKFPPAGGGPEPEVTLTHEPLAIEQPTEGRPTLRLSGKVSGAPPGTYLNLDAGRVWWPQDGGYRPGARLFVTSGRPPESVVRDVAGMDSPGGGAVAWKASGLSQPEMSSPGDPRRFQVALTAHLMRGRLIGEMPLRAGAELRSGASLTRIVALERSDQRLIVWLEERDAWPPWSTRPVDSFLLRHPGIFADAGETRSLEFDSFSIRWRQFSIPVPTREVNGLTEEIPGWQEAASLVKVRFSSDQWFTLMLAVDPTSFAAR